MIYTSYYANKNLLNKENVIATISATTPYPKWIRFNFLAPDYDMVDKFKKKVITQSDFEALYIEKLNNISEESLKAFKMALNYYRTRADKHLVLCCWEGKGKFCHRHLLAKFIKEKFDIDVEELD